jgi:hypothetical protein
MNPKHVRTECFLDDDPRLFSALSAVVEHSAAQVGLPEARAKKLLEAAKLCLKDAWAASQGSHDGHTLKVICEEFDDRLELKLKKDSGEKFCEGASLSKAAEIVSRVSPEVQNGVFTLTLTEFASADSSKKRPEQAEKKSSA